MLSCSPCSVLRADDPTGRTSCCCSSDSRMAATSEARWHPEPLQIAAAGSSGRTSGAASGVNFMSLRRGGKEGFGTSRVKEGFLKGRYGGEDGWQRASPRRTEVGASGDGERSRVRKKEEEAAVSVTQILERGTREGQRGNREDMVEVRIEKLGINSRKIVAKIAIEAPLDSVWAILTDYEHLADFIPGLAVSELLEKRHNGARLYQVGEQNLALGVKFKAKAVVDCEEKPTKVHKDFVRRDIDFETVEGDFQVFRGTWRMEQPVSRLSSTSRADVPVGGGAAAAGEEVIATILSYIVIVQPKIWLPVGLVEGRLTSEMKTNLVCIRERSLQPASR